MLQAIIDIGSNTVRMVVYDLENGKAKQIMKKKHLVGLAAFLKDGVMQQAGIDRVCEVLNEYREFLTAFHISRVAAFTTAALRNAKNSAAAVAEITERTGIAIRVISGIEEAEYDFIGATYGLKEQSGLLIDIGGASTEVVYFSDGQIVTKTSLLMGSLSLHSKYSAGLLPTAAEIKAMQDEIADILDTAVELDSVSEAHVCGIGGTFKGASALYNLTYGQPKENALLDAAKLPELIKRYQAGKELSEEELIIFFKACADRLHTIVPGMLIADALAKRFGSKTITYSDSGVREGYIYKELL